MKFKKKLIIKLSGESPLPDSIVKHFIVFFNDIKGIFSETFNNESDKVEIEIKEPELDGIHKHHKTRKHHSKKPHHLF